MLKAIGYSSIDWELRQAAALDGANRLQIFRYIMAFGLKFHQISKNEIDRRVKDTSNSIEATVGVVELTGNEILLYMINNQ